MNILAPPARSKPFIARAIHLHRLHTRIALMAFRG